MRVLLLMFLGVLILAAPILGLIGPIELMVLAILVAAWFVALFKWAIPGDRRAKQSTPA